MARVLAAAGYEAVTAGDGAEGIRTYREKPEGVVIVDLVMPEKEGLETIRDLRKEFPSATVLAMTAHVSMRPLLKAAIGFGALRAFEKPIENEHLVSLVRSVAA